MTPNDKKLLLSRRATTAGLSSPFALPPFPAFPAKLKSIDPALGEMEAAIKRWLQNLDQVLASVRPVEAAPSQAVAVAPSVTTTVTKVVGGGGSSGPVAPGAPGADGASVEWQGTYAVAPSSPSLNQAYRNSADGKVYIYTVSGWQEMVEDGATGPSGVGIEWLGALAVAPGTPTLNQAYRNTVDKKVYVWDGAAWQEMTEDGGAGTPGAAGPSVRALMLCAALTPSATGADSGEVMVPYASDGTTVVTWNVKRISLRVASAGGAPAVTVEKSTVAGAFAAATVGTVTLAGGANEGSVTAALGTVDSGNKLRFNVGTLGTAQNWSIVVELSV